MAQLEDDEENMGDVDLWALAGGISSSSTSGGDGKEEGKDQQLQQDGGEDTSSLSLTVNDKWLQHLQDRLLGEDGHPRKARPGEDPHSNGLVLEWIYGSIVSTAEKARDGAKRFLGSYMPTAAEAHAVLIK